MMQAADELITLKTKVCRPVSRRLSVTERGSPLWNSLTHKFQTSEKFRATAQIVSKSGIFWNDKESRFPLFVEQRFKKHEFQADHDRIQELNDRVSKRRNFRVHQGDERLQRDQQLLHELLEQNWDLREAHEKSFNEMEELKPFQGSTFDAFARRKLVEIETQTLNSQTSSKCN